MTCPTHMLACANALKSQESDGWDLLNRLEPRISSIRWIRWICWENAASPLTRKWTSHWLPIGSWCNLGCEQCGVHQMKGQDCKMRWALWTQMMTNDTVLYSRVRHRMCAQEVDLHPEFRILTENNGEFFKRKNKKK